MNNDFMGWGGQAQGQTQGQAQGQTPSPGKGQSLPKTTAQLPATMSDAITKGDFCKNDGAGSARCGYLSEDARKEMIDETRDRLGDWLQNLHSAVAGARIEVATETEQGMSWLADMLFEMVAGGVMLGVVGLAVSAAGRFAQTLATRGVPAIRQRIAAHDFAEKFEASRDSIQDVLLEGSHVIADRVKKSFEPGSDAKHGKDLFLQGIASRATEVKEHIAENVPRLDDVDLSCLYDAYATANHSVGRYANFLEGLLARYDSNKIGELGKVKGDGVGHVLRAVKLRAYGTAKTALVEQVKDVGLKQRPKFVRWVDGDFAALAQARTAATDTVTFAGVGVDTVIDVTTGWDNLDPDGNLELQIWLNNCRDASTVPVTWVQPPTPIDDTLNDPARNFVNADDGGEE